MIREIQIENFKSIKKMKLELGRVNVFIGENGSGKSNILEAVALAGAAVGGKLDNEFLASRGIRATEARHMRCALDGSSNGENIVINIIASDSTRAELKLSHDGKPYSSWKRERGPTSFLQSNTRQVIDDVERVLKEKARELNLELNQPSNKKSQEEHLNEIAALESVILSVKKTLEQTESNLEALEQFFIYSPENYSLRVFQQEGQIEPLGIRGEGLLKFLKVLSENTEYANVLAAIRERLKVLGWFEDLRVPATAISLASKIEIKDRYLRKEAGNLDQISANEGFLFLLFYFCLFSTELTPRFFAIDNVDASLNPKLCAHLVIELAKLAQENEKQVILTTHNPAALDGLDLNDDEQRLFVISRGDEGETKIRRIKRKEGSSRDIKLSAAFINGYLGGLPKNF